MYKGKIPFDQHGTPVPYCLHGDDRYIWRDNEVFRAEDRPYGLIEANLYFVRFHRGRSAANAVYVKHDDPSWEVTMFLSDFQEIVTRGLAPKHLSGRFEFVKRGSNYGIKLLLIDA